MEELQLSLKKMVLETCRVKGVKPEDITNEEPVIGGRGAAPLDSLDAVEIATSLERHFGLRAENMPMKNIFHSYKLLNDYIGQHAPADRIEQFIGKYK